MRQSKQNIEVEVEVEVEIIILVLQQYCIDEYRAILVSNKLTYLLKKNISLLKMR